MLRRVNENYTFLPPGGSLLLKNGTECQIKDPMQYEGTRLSTFATFPEIKGVYTTRLAGAGFFYTGHGDEVVCFNCHISHKNWKQHDSPEEIHSRLSPHCDFIRNTSSNLKKYSTVGNNVRSEARRSPSLNKTINNISSFDMTGAEACQTSNNYSPIFNNTINNISSLDITRTESYQMPNNYSNNDANSLITISQPHLSSLNNNTLESNSQSLSQITTTNRTIVSQDLPEQMTMGVCIDNPRYPKYAIKMSRLDSFKYWPTYLTQSPDEMVSAGFFFTGKEDHCRCFVCGGGLRNWEPGDQPWVEHARWYQNCAFVRQSKGDRFIEDVQTNNYMLTKNLEKNGLPNTKRSLDDFESIPVVISVSQFGYDEKLVKEAYDTLKKSGTSDITSTELLEAIFNLEENFKQSKDDINHNKQQMENSQSVIGTVNHKEIIHTATSDPKPELSVRSLEQENQNLKDQQTCKICLDEPISIVFLPCGHLAACINCAPALRRCPICRTFIKGTVKAILCLCLGFM